MNGAGVPGAPTLSVAPGMGQRDRGMTLGQKDKLRGPFLALYWGCAQRGGGKAAPGPSAQPPPHRVPCNVFSH